MEKTSNINMKALINLSSLIAYHIFSLIIYFVAASHYLGRPFIPALAIDYEIPYIEAFAIFYVYAFYMLLALSDLYYALIATGKFNRYLFASILNVVLASLIYILFPTKYILRAKNLPDTFLSHIMQRYYNTDVTMNCLPSLHVASSMLVAFFIYEDNRNFYGWTAIIIASLVSISTVFVRQHYILDIPAGIFHALFIYWISKRIIKAKRDKPYINRKIWRLIIIATLVLVPIFTSTYLLIEEQIQQFSK